MHCFPLYPFLRSHVVILPSLWMSRSPQCCNKFHHFQIELHLDVDVVIFLWGHLLKKLNTLYIPPFLIWYIWNWISKFKWIFILTQPYQNKFCYTHIPTSFGLTINTKIPKIRLLGMTKYVFFQNVPIPKL